MINAIPECGHYLAMVHFVKMDSAQTHLAVCLLMRLLQDKYMPDLHVDATGFWENLDFRSLEAEYGYMGALIGVFRKSMESGTLRKHVGVEIAGSGKVTMLDTNLPEPVRGKTAKAKSGRLN